MSLLLKGMDMPKNCYHCRFNYDNLCHALQLSFSYIRENDNISCPLIEIPTPHGRLIDADDLDSITVISYPSKGDPFVAGRLKKIIAPTIIEAEVSE